MNIKKVPEKIVEEEKDEEKKGDCENELCAETEKVLLKGMANGRYQLSKAKDAALSSVSESENG